MERPPDGEAVGALVFCHGFYGIPEEFVAFVDELDPARRLHGFLPQAPFEVADGRYSWHRQGPVEPDDLRPVLDWLAGLPYGPEATIFGGWSQGTSVAYALALGLGRPRPAGLIALGGWLPEDVQLDLAPPLPPVAIAHGTADGSVPVDAARTARSLLEEAGAHVLYRETEIGHRIDPVVVPDLRAFVAGCL